MVIAEFGLLDKFSERRAGPEQLEDQDYRGTVTARYLFKAGQVIDQQQVASSEPPRESVQFGAVEEEFRYMTAATGARVALGVGHLLASGLWSPVIK